MYSIDLPECSIYRALRKDIISDLIGNGVPSSAAGAIVNFYDPSEDCYLQRVSAWQVLLCTHVCDDPSLLPQCFSERRWVRRAVGGSSMVLDMPAWLIDQINGVVQLVYKYPSKPRTAVDLEAVKSRFRRPGHISLSQEEVSRIRHWLSPVSAPLSWDDMVGSFGPGSTSDRINLVDRWNWKGIKFPTSVPMVVWPIRKLDDWALEGWKNSQRYGITRIAEVPKNLKSNRVVSSEPAGFLFCQKAVGDFMRRQILYKIGSECHLDDRFKHNALLRASDRYCECVTLRNGRMSRIHKRDRYTSIDLSDASDHVSRTLVRMLLPDWADYLFSVRSTFARFPDGELVPLRTFAPMGSDVCFPVLTLVCYGIAKAVCGDSKIGVFGDDIIVPMRYFDSTVDMLQRAGLVVNARKSGTVGRYVESCGQEFYNVLLPAGDVASFEVTATKIRTPFDKVDVLTLDKWFCNWDRMGWVNTEETVMSLTKALKRLRWNSQLQRLEVLTRREVPLERGYDLTGYHGFLRWCCLRTKYEDGRPKDIYTPSGRTRLEPFWAPVEDLPHLTRFITRLQIN